MNGEPETNEPVDPSHLEAAREFFNDNAESGEAREPSTEESAPETKSLLGDALGTKSESQKEEAPQAEEEFEAPPEQSKHRPEWDKLKKAHAEAKAKVEELESQVKVTGEPEAVESLRARVKELEDQNSQFSNRLKDVDFKSHPEYFEQFEKPVQEARKSMKELADMEAVDVNLDALLKMKGKQFAEGVSEIVDQLTKFNGDEFSRLARDAHKVVMSAEKAGENSEEFIQKATEDFKARTRATFDEVGAEYGQLFGKAETHEGADDNLVAANQAYNEALDGVSQVAEGIAFGGLDDRNMSQVAHESAMFRFLMSQGLPRVEQFASAQITARDSQIAELTEELSQYKAAQPGYSPTGNTAPIASTIEDMGHQDAARLIDFAAGSSAAHGVGRKL